MSELTKKYIKELDAGIRDLFESERWTGYLRFLSRFHRYSVNNTLAIYAQRPDATLVASFTDWKRMGRSVKKDERGMKIIAKHETKETDETTGEEKRHIGFHLAHCFDVSQTAGDDLPENPCQTLRADVDGYDALLVALRDVSPAPIEIKAIQSAANGYYLPDNDQIVVKAGLSQAQTVKTAIHEIAHAMLHGRGKSHEKTDQRTREVQAESVAYVVCQCIGVDSSDYSFGYIAGWSKSKELQELKASIKAISRTADRIIDGLKIQKGGATCVKD